MTNAQMLATRMSEVEKMKVRMSTSEAQLVSLYHTYRNELSGGPVHGGTVEEGLEEMREVRALLISKFDEASASAGF